MKIVADPNIPFVREAFEPMGEVALVPGREMNPAVARDADALLVRSVTPVNEALLAGSSVRFVGTATIGTDHINVEYLARRGIGFASAAGSNANSVAEYVVAALLELAHSDKFRLRDKTLGVVGVGNAGSKVALYAEVLGMDVLRNDPPRQRVEHLPDFVSLDRVLAEADIVTLHVPLTREGEDATYHLLDATRLERFIVINTARGAVVDNRALLKAIDGDRIPAAVLDVWEGEPNISPELLEVVDIGTPHIAGYSFDGKVAGVRMIYEAFCRQFQLEPKWTPELPGGLQVEMTVSSGEDEQEVLRRIVRRNYDIMADDAALRRDVRSFDRLRAEYPTRREFSTTQLTLRGASDSLREKCAALGFRLT